MLTCDCSCPPECNCPCCSKQTPSFEIKAVSVDGQLVKIPSIFVKA